MSKPPALKEDDVNKSSIENFKTRFSRLIEKEKAENKQLLSFRFTAFQGNKIAGD